MGQSFIFVNTEKEEYYSFPHGRKFGELVYNEPEVFAFLLFEGAHRPPGLETLENMGRWAGDPVSVVGEYDESSVYAYAMENFKDITDLVRHNVEKFCDWVGLRHALSEGGKAMAELRRKKLKPVPGAPKMVTTGIAKCKECHHKDKCRKLKKTKPCVLFVHPEVFSLLCADCSTGAIKYLETVDADQYDTRAGWKRCYHGGMGSGVCLADSEPCRAFFRWALGNYFCANCKASIGSYARLQEERKPK